MNSTTGWRDELSLQALRFKPGTEPPIQIRLETDSIQAFALVRSQDLPSAYVVSNADLVLLRKFKDLIVDRGTKHRAKGLSAVLLGYDRMPLLGGSYTSSAQLVRSVRTLLRNAVKMREQNVYLVGADEKLVRDLWAKAGGNDGATLNKLMTGEDSVKQHATFPASQDLLLEFLPPQAVPSELVERYIGSSVEVQLVRQLILRAASINEPVLIVGDTGSGKEVVARCIHAQSGRIEFTAVNCGAIPGELLEALLFGSASGVATDVRERDGLWKIAGDGTLFLDEIADLRLDHQVKILRALQEGRIRPVGAAREISVGARVIAATNRDLFAMVRSGQFREDLYYRLRSFLIRTPPLRDHPEDIAALTQHFWKEITKDRRAVLPDHLVSELQRQRWPGNSRELRSVLSSVYTLFGRSDLRVDHLKVVFRLEGQESEGGKVGPQGISLHRVECLRHLRRVDEVVRATRITLQPVLERKRHDPGAAESVHVSLRERLNELELLCMRPLLFHSEVAFSVVYRLKGKLSYFGSLLKTDGAAALRYWRKEVADEFKLVLTTVFQEVQRLTES
jgi:DNA-binding NtrC family response regulator